MKYKYVPNKAMWSRYKSVLSVPEWKNDLERFFNIVENPNPNDPDECSLKKVVNDGHWDLVFYYWTHNFDTDWTTVILAKFLDECGIDFMKSFRDPYSDQNYFYADEIVAEEE